MLPADAARSATRLRALGHEVVVAPLFEIAPTHAPMPEGAFDALLATSAHAFDALPAEAERLKPLALHVVGARTAEAAQRVGFSPKLEEPDAKALAIAIARRDRARKTFLYLAGRERRPELEASLTALGHAITPWLVYETREAPDGLVRLTEALTRQRVDAALHFSPRSAALYLALAEQAGLSAAALEPIQIAISKRAGEALLAATDLRIAGTPDFDGLIACL